MTNGIDAKNIPWASFCLATYRRPELLAKTLESIKQQTMPDFEVIISDNDPEGSSRSVVEELKDQRFQYFCNEQNVGMVKNFNRALARARGEFVVMITDDDPPYAEMLETLRKLQQDYPGYGAYYGACNLNFVKSEVAEFYNISTGLVSKLANLPIGSIRSFSSREFPIAYFANQIFPYVLWSTGIVRREIALEIEGMPDYGSPYLTDFGYICLVGSHSGCVTINKALGHQTVHDGNFGRKECGELMIAVEGCYQYIQQRMCDRTDWPVIQQKLEKFLANWVINHSLFLRKYFKFYHIKNKDLYPILRQIFGLSYMQKYRWQYLVKLYSPLFMIEGYHKLASVKATLKNKKG